MSIFLWGGSDNSKKLHLVDWNIIFLPLDKDGLGIFWLEDLNATLIDKWIYRFVNENESLWR